MWQIGGTKSKVHSSNCVVRGNNQQLNILITYDEFTFSVNDEIQKANAWKDDIFLRHNSQRQETMVSKLILLYLRINLVSFIPKDEKKSVHQTELKKTEDVGIFEYKKNNDKY